MRLVLSTLFGSNLSPLKGLWTFPWALFPKTRAIGPYSLKKKVIEPLQSMRQHVPGHTDTGGGQIAHNVASKYISGI